MEILGIDVGGSGIKGALVNIETGELTTERFRLPTPQPSKPQKVADTIQKVIDHFDYKGPVGCGFPTLVHHGKARLHSNLDPAWTGIQIDELFQKKTGLPFVIINDADAAGIAEMSFGAGKGQKGVVIMITVGTGLGSGFFVDGKLIPNFELGRLIYKDDLFEKYAADSVREAKELTWKKWGKRFNKYLNHIDMLFSPDLIIIGGGASKKLDRFEDQITIETPFVAAETMNEAGIIGAAMAAKDLV